MGIIKSRKTKFITKSSDGTRTTTYNGKVLEVSEKFRTEVMNAMTEILQSTVNGYFSPSSK